MFYIKSQQEDKKAINYIKDCLNAYSKLKLEKEELLLKQYSQYKNGELTVQSTLDTEEEIERIENYIEAIAYTYEYVKLMIKLKTNNY